MERRVFKTSSTVVITDIIWYVTPYVLTHMFGIFHKCFLHDCVVEEVDGWIQQ